MSSENKKTGKANSYEALKALYYSGKVKPTLNKTLVELENDAENIDLISLACQCLIRTKDFDKLIYFADRLIKLDPKQALGYYLKGVALHHAKGKEQEALKNLNNALEIEPENVIYLKDKATTHLLLFKDYHLPLNLAEKHRDKGEESLLKIITLVEQKENPDYMEYLTIADVSIIVNRNMDAKKYYIKAVNAFEKAEPIDQDMNIFKDIIKAQKACNKIIEKFTE